MKCVPNGNRIGACKEGSCFIWIIYKFLSCNLTSLMHFHELLVRSEVTNLTLFFSALWLLIIWIHPFKRSFSPQLNERLCNTTSIAFCLLYSLNSNFREEVFIFSPSYFHKKFKIYLNYGNVHITLKKLNSPSCKANTLRKCSKFLEGLLHLCSNMF